jgi:hypothetical protein
MAGDWIKIEEGMPEKPEVSIIADALGIPDPDTVAGKLVRVWSWATRNCNADGVTNVTAMKLIDRCAGVAGFAQAMQKAGWLDVNGDILTFPNFGRHCSQTAKERALTSKRVTRHRKRECNGESVTKPLPEKRREEKNKSTPQPPADEGKEIAPLCTIEQAVSYAPTVRLTETEARHWWHTRNASGWTRGAAGGGAPRQIRSWQSDMAASAQWVREGAAKAKTAQTADGKAFTPAFAGHRPDK